MEINTKLITNSNSNNSTFFCKCKCCPRQSRMQQLKPTKESLFQKNKKTLLVNKTKMGWSSLMERLNYSKVKEKCAKKKEDGRKKGKQQKQKTNALSTNRIIKHWDREKYTMKEKEIVKSWEEWWPTLTAVLSHPKQLRDNVASYKLWCDVPSSIFMLMLKFSCL